MAPDFKPPKDEAEFEKRAALVSTEGARAVIKALERRRASMVAGIDEEINFYKKIVESREVKY